MKEKNKKYSVKQNSFTEKLSDKRDFSQKEKNCLNSEKIVLLARMKKTWLVLVLVQQLASSSRSLVLALVLVQLLASLPSCQALRLLPDMEETCSRPLGIQDGSVR